MTTTPKKRIRFQGVSLNLSNARIVARARTLLSHQRRSGVRVYPALSVADGGSKVLPAPAKKPRGPRICSLAKFEEDRMKEFIQLQIAKGNKP